MRNREKMLPAFAYRNALAGLFAVTLLVQAVRAQTMEAVRVIASAPDRKESLPGEFLPFLQVAIHAKVEGFVDKVEVDRGSLVREGQLLATMTAPELDAQRAE